MNPAKTTPIPLTPDERRAAVGLAGIYGLRMLGLFLILPVFALYAGGLKGATPLLIGLAIGAYGLTQAILQIPFGMLSDRIGRKPVIYGGLAVFVLGSAIAALATTIDGVILGRVIQGAGAVSAAVTALAADLTRDEVRTRAMAGVGASIGIAFGLAFIIGPAIAQVWGLSGVFWLTALLAFGGILVLWLVVPNPKRRSVHRDAEPVASQLGAVLRDGQLLRLNFGIFSLHLMMTGMFLVIPPAIVKAGVAAAHHWEVYLPVLLLGLIAMVPFVIFAEGRGRIKPVFLGAIATVGLTALGFALWSTQLIPLMVLLAVFFTAVNLLEALLPSIISKIARAGAKGTAMGVYSTSQFIGAFLGGMTGGLVNQYLGAPAVFVFAALCALAWLLVAGTMAAPERLTNQLLPLDPLGPLDAGQVLALEQRLLAVTGVRDAVVAPDEGVAYLKVDSRELDSASLQAIAG
ncbi:MFS transporter [uncultured Thiodictyon sp.]|uniref:MFS transporter n=1 Tax=uncultured Thiodictyon sp. TaxID=1846217 RepID=UPI0025FDD3E2|nr:MFS transporter [uncultured Thiodictyon sp.]